MGQWKKVWNYIPVNWGTQVGTIENLTQKVWIRNNLNGTQVRIQFCNLYDMDVLVLDSVMIGKWDKEAEKVTGIQEVTCQGKPVIQIQPGDSFYSDNISLPVKETDNLVISIYCKEKHDVYSVCQTWNAQSFKSLFFEDDQVKSDKLQGMSTVEAFPFFGYDENVCNGAVGICGMQVLTEDAVTTVACFGDAGVRRFERDVYGDATPDIVFFLEGVNDCTHGLAFGIPTEVPDGENLFTGIKEIIEKAHKRNSKIYISTVMPFGCYEDAFREQAEGIRQDLNELIRKNQEIADGFLDLDQIMRKQEDIHFMKDGMHLGDGVHPNEAGGREIAAAIVEKWF